MTQFLRDNGKSVDGFYLSHSFGLAKSTKRNNTNITLFLNQNSKDVEKRLGVFHGFDKSWQKFQDLCKEA